jgi:hypothetical protein
MNSVGSVGRHELPACITPNDAADLDWAALVCAGQAPRIPARHSLAVSCGADLRGAAGTAAWGVVKSGPFISFFFRTVTRDQSMSLASDFSFFAPC